MKDFIKLTFCGLLVAAVLAFGAKIFGINFLFASLLIFLAFVLPYNRLMKAGMDVAENKLYFLVSGSVGFTVYLILWVLHGTLNRHGGSFPISIFDVFISLVVWFFADRKIGKFFKIKRHKKKLTSISKAD